MATEFQPIHPGELLNGGAGNQIALYDGGNGPYLVKKDATGTVTFQPMTLVVKKLEEVEAQQVGAREIAPRRVTAAPDRDWLPTAIPIALGGCLVLALFYQQGFMAGGGAAPQQPPVVVVQPPAPPAPPVCDTTRSSFLGWSTERKECQ